MSMTTAERKLLGSFSSRRALARSTGLHPSYVSRILNGDRGQRGPSLAVARKWAKAIGISLDELNKRLRTHATRSAAAVAMALLSAWMALPVSADQVSAVTPGALGGGGAFTGGDVTGQTNFCGPDATSNVEIGSCATDANGASGGNNVAIGDGAGVGKGVDTANSVFIGKGAGAGGNISGASNTVVGATALDATNNASAINNSAFGFSALGGVTSGSNNTAVGFNAGNNITTGTNNTLIGASTACSAVASIVIGAGASCSANNQMVIGGNGLQIAEAFIGEGINNASPVDVLFGATGGSGTDIAGADLTLAGGRGTGSAAGGDLNVQTSPSLTSGATVQTFETRSKVVAKQFALSDNTIVTFATMTLGNDTGGGATIEYCIKVRDATNEQMECGAVNFAGVDITAGAGGETCANGIKSGGVQALSAGTLAVTFTGSAGTDLCNWRVTSDTSLVATEHWIKYSITHNSGQVITPQ